MSIEKQVTPKALIIRESAEMRDYRIALSRWVRNEITYDELIKDYYPQSLLTLPERAVRFFRSLRHKPTSK